MRLDSVKVKPAALVSFFIALISLFLLVGFRTVPVSQLWKNYQVLYVYSDELSESDIFYVLEKNGIENAIYRGNQRFPVVSSASPVQPQSSDSYIYARNAFFTDKTSSALVFYVPDSQRKNLDQAVTEISSFQNTVCGTDGKSAFPWISPIFSLAFAIVLLCFSHEKMLFLFSAFFPVLLSFCRPLYTVAASSIFLLFSFYLLQKIWQRRNFKKTFLNSPYALVFAFSPFLILIFSSIGSAVFYAISVLASLCSIKIYHAIEIRNLKKNDFAPVMIASSKMIPLIGHTGIRLMGFMSLVLIFLGLCFAVLGRISSRSSSSASPALPSPVSKNDSVLPNLDDFFDWSWNTITFPYRRISSVSQKPFYGETVSIPDYAENSDGLISSYESQIYAYDEKFRDSVESQVEQLSYPALEKMMMEQGKNSYFGYSKGKVSSPEKFGKILLLFFVLISAGFSGYYIMGRKKYGQSI